MTRRSFILLAFGLLFLAACGDPEPFCPPPAGTPEYLSLPPESLPTPTFDLIPTQYPVEIGNKTILVDKIVEGPLCNDTWSGTVYVACDVQVYPWDETPLFLEDCDLSIAPDTVVYVAYHNNTAYYNGCSCHTGELTEP
jgi:hypothetical protein